MLALSSLFKSRDKPQNRTPGSSYAFFLGGSTSGKAVTERSAMQMTAVYSCVRILAEAMLRVLKDPALSQRLKTAAQARAEEFSCERYRAKLIELMEKE